jgi:bla regulator protein blaR1
MIPLILEATVRSLVLGVVVWLALLAFRPRNPHMHKTVWIGVLLASLVMPFVLRARIAPSFDVPMQIITLTQSMGRTTNESAASLMPLGVITTVYALVVLALLARFAVGLVAMWRIRRTATRLPNTEGFDVRVSTKIASPATFGSTILLPSGSEAWSEERRAAILSHERSHVRYWDCYVQWVARIHACFFWFNPLAWWLARRLADLAETTSDDAVMEAMPDRTAYADLLLEIARHPAPAGVVTSAARSNISARIERIISGIPPASPPRRWVRGVAAVSLLPLFVLAAANAQIANPPTNPIPESSAGDPTAAHAIDLGNSGLEDNYPAEAKRKGIEGRVVVNATLDEEGRVTFVQIIEEYPADEEYGFAAAAEKVARQIRFSNPKHQTTQVKFQVKFALSDKKQVPPDGTPGTTTTFPPASDPPR